MAQVLDDDHADSAPPGPAAARIESSAIRDLLALTERPGVISLAGGKPAPDTFPVDAVRTATDAVLTRDGQAALQYSATEGYRPLRAWMAEHHHVHAEQVIVTSGSQQGLDLVARGLVAPGETVVCADPGYVGAIQAFRLAGANLVGLPSDNNGLQVDALVDHLARGLRPRLVYVIPELSNPTGATLSEPRRQVLAELADRYGFWLVEDDPYRALRWAGQSLAPLAGRSDRVVSLGTVSKVLCPGLRVGHLIAAPQVCTAVALVKQAVDLHTSTLSQRVVCELITQAGFLDRHLATLPRHYQERANALTAALRRHLSSLVDFTEPQGGMFVWARLGGDTRTVGTAGLLDQALAAGVAFVPGNAFSVTLPHHDHLRLSFATPTPDEIAEGVRRLATVIRAG